MREKTLTVFDEVQLCERVLASLKYFCEDIADYHIIAAGSLPGVAVSRAGVYFPVGKVDIKTLYAEFCHEGRKKTVPLYAAFCI